jgi:hypothetical protein
VVDENDDGFVFDEDFVRGASRKEESAQERLEKSQRVAREHLRVVQGDGGWRGPSTPKPGRAGKGPRKVRGPLTLVVALAVTAGLVFVSQRGGSGASDAATYDAQHRPPVPSDARKTPFGKPAAPPAGTGGYLVIPETQVNGLDVRWSPCRTIHYVVRHDREPLGGPELISDAFREISAATGLRFVNDGSTDEIPSDDRLIVDEKRYGARWSPVLVAWATVAEAPELQDDVDGYASPYPAIDEGLHLVSGQVVLDEAQMTDRTGHARPGSKLVMMHEIGHLLGLGHVTDKQSLMYPVLDKQPGLSAGDLRGLAHAGTGPCFA